jgi:hypothetical protein
MSKFNGRNNYLINPKVQLSFVLFFLFLSLVTTALFYIYTLMNLNELQMIAAENTIVGQEQLINLIKDYKLHTSHVFLFTALISSTFILIGGIYLSHKVAGPVYRMIKYFKMRRNNEHNGPLQLRKDDFFHDLKDEINAFFEDEEEREEIEKTA